MGASNFFGGLLEGFGTGFYSQKLSQIEKQKLAYEAQRKMIGDFLSDPNIDPETKRAGLIATLRPMPEGESIFGAGIRKLTGKGKKTEVDPLSQFMSLLEKLPLHGQAETPATKAEIPGGGISGQERIGAVPSVPGSDPKSPDAGTTLPSIPALLGHPRIQGVYRPEGELEPDKVKEVTAALGRAKSPTERAVVAAVYGIKLPEQPTVVDPGLLNQVKSAMSDLPQPIQLDLLNQFALQTSTGKTEEGLKEVFRSVSDFHKEQARDAASEKRSKESDARQERTINALAARQERMIQSQIDRDERRSEPKPLNASQKQQMKAAINTGNSLIRSIDAILQIDPRTGETKASVLRSWVKSSRAAASGTFLGRLPGISATPEELAVETAFKRLPEQVNIFRKSYNATGFRGPQGWEALQQLAGNYRQNPELTIQVLQAAKQDAEQFISDANEALGGGTVYNYDAQGNPIP